MTYLVSESQTDECVLVTLLLEIMQAHFLHRSAQHDLLATLEERRESTKRLLTFIREELAHTPYHHMAPYAMLNHACILLEAELSWLNRTIPSLCSNPFIQEQELLPRQGTFPGNTDPMRHEK